MKIHNCLVEECRIEINIEKIEERGYKNEKVQIFYNET